MKTFINMEVTELDEALEKKGFELFEKEVKDDSKNISWSNDNVILGFIYYPEPIPGFDIKFLTLATVEFKSFEQIRNDIKRLNLKSEPYETEKGIGTRYFDGIYEVTVYKHLLKNSTSSYHIQLLVKVKKE